MTQIAVSQAVRRRLFSVPRARVAHRHPWRHWVAAALTAVAAGTLAPAWAQGSAGAAQAPVRSINEWLTRMHEASRMRAYTGTLVVTAGASMSASKIWHVCDGTRQMERVDTLTGEPRTTLRRDNEVITFIPESRTAVVEKRESLGLFPDMLRTPENLIPGFYSVRELGHQRVAGHLADMVEILPKDDLRFGYRIWSEQGTGLVVKLQTLGPQGAVLEQVAFTELQLDAPVSMEKLAASMKDTRGYEVVRPALKKTTPEAQGWRLKEPVPGFSSMSCHVRESETPAKGGSAPMQWVFSDGLASVSLFVEPYDPRQHVQEKAATMGATQSVSRRVGEYWVTALGEVPRATLQRFTRSLERARP
ncbi:MucB/RseB C-terminal domain-containing protein [Hydrogenophaga sp. IBVHS2]|uniref:MucB/RseB C-terminal domain-containing protein n=1 Tax=Hydrogenophaga sp. IBVHS2 TaxID=1985170 RepID=UPI000A2E8935|nr:MucB/RseB C-terminal domain-containing protein [Hydrogenophaga sp. IBVHS2]OSZ67543.1 transcriptional regulator [Hydrogenophaga sp. IBVHS2]